MERGGVDVALSFTGLIAVTLTSVASAYRAVTAGDVGSAAFVGASYAALLLLFRSLRAYERLPPPGADDDADGRRRRRQVKSEVWALCTLLTVLFAWKVAAAMPSWPVAAAVWAMAVVTAAGGFLALKTTYRYSNFSVQRMERGGVDAALAFTGLIAVTLTSVASAYRAVTAGDVASAAFVGPSYAVLLLLFRSLRAYERLPPPPGADDDADGRRRRRQVKREVWALCTLLTVLFAWKVAAVMPSWPVAAAVWAMAVVTAVGGCLALFGHP